jgi:far upstream element-binding protein
LLDGEDSYAQFDGVKDPNQALEQANREFSILRTEDVPRTASRTGFSNFGNNSFSYTQGCNPNIINTLNDTSKIKRKIYMPKTNKFNYTGLIIGPKGANQKRLEEETGCKILVRGRGSQKDGAPPQPDDNEDLHVLVAGENELQVVRACEEIEKIIFADEDSRNNIRQAQLKIVAQIKNTDPLEQPTDDMDLSLTTPYGPPSHDAFVIAVTKDCVGLVIRRFGETIRRLQVESGAAKVQVAADNKPGAEFRNVFVESTEDACQKVNL